MDRARERFLVQQFQKGNADAFLKLVHAFERRLLYFLRRFEHDQERALDLLQEVWMTAWKSRSSLRSPDAFRTWIYRIGHGKIVAAIRAETRRRRTEKLRADSFSPTETHPSDAIESAELVHFALSSISPSHREILTLRFLEEMTIPEIAFVIGCPEGTVKSRLHHATEEFAAVAKEQARAEE